MYPMFWKKVWRVFFSGFRFKGNPSLLAVSYTGMGRKNKNAHERYRSVRERSQREHDLRGKDVALILPVEIAAVFFDDRVDAF